MSKHKYPAPELDSAWLQIPDDIPEGISVRFQMMRIGSTARVYVWWELAAVTSEGRYLPAYRFGEEASMASDAQMRGSAFRAACRLRIWWEERKPEESARLVAWEAGAVGLAGRAPRLR